MRSERQAIRMALSLVKQPWTGDDDFSRSMRLLQKSLVRLKKPLTKQQKSSTVPKQ